MGEYISSNLSKYRKEAQLTQEQLANKVGVTRQTIISIEKGHYTPSVLLALKISHVLNKSVSDLFKLKNE